MNANKKTYLGIDIVEISRIRKAVIRWGDRFLQRIYTDSELKLFRNKTESLAVRFAGKEAAIKAFYIQGLCYSWKEFEILSHPDGRPLLILHGEAKRGMSTLGINIVEISLSHTRQNAIAIVIGERED